MRVRLQRSPRSELPWGPRRGLIGVTWGPLETLVARPYGPYMLSVPATLDEWDYEIIVALLAAHAYEDLRFDWKEGVPHRSAEGLKKDLIKNAVGMANGDGGFLIFGVDDDREMNAGARVRGIPAAQEVQKEVAELLRAADPHVPFIPRQPPIALPDSVDRVVAVIEVLTTLAPHSYDHVFYKRTLRGSDRMTTQEVRDLFIRKEERHARVRMLLLELATVAETLALARLPFEIPAAMRIRRIDTRMLAQLQAELSPALAEHPELASKLTSLRSFGEAFNSQVERAIHYLGSRTDFVLTTRSNPPVLQVSQELGKMASAPATNLVNDLISDLARAFGESPPKPRGEAEFQRDGW